MNRDNFIITRKQAIAIGLKRYFTGRECLRSHISWRSTANGACSECLKEDQRKRKSEVAEALHEKRQRDLGQSDIDIPVFLPVKAAPLADQKPVIKKVSNGYQCWTPGDKSKTKRYGITPAQAFKNWEWAIKTGKVSK